MAKSHRWFCNLLNGTAALVGFAMGAGANAQTDFNPAGNWFCSASYFQQGLQPYGFQADLRVSANGNLDASGAVYDPNLINSVQEFRASGDWSVFPDSNGTFVRMRMHTQKKGILVFEGYATSAKTIYATRTYDSFKVETQCERRR
jgi:hypothetical protein